MFRLKLFLKKAARKTDKTLRRVWVNTFPHIPLTKKVIGSRMGKGKGKLSI
jgi:ribosomal protein L16/L10AE